MTTCALKFSGPGDWIGSRPNITSQPAKPRNSTTTSTNSGATIKNQSDTAAPRQTSAGPTRDEHGQAADDQKREQSDVRPRAARAGGGTGRLQQRPAGPVSG